MRLLSIVGALALTSISFAQAEGPLADLEKLRRFWRLAESARVEKEAWRAARWLAEAARLPNLVPLPGIDGDARTYLRERALEELHGALARPNLGKIGMPCAHCQGDGIVPCSLCEGRGGGGGGVASCVVSEACPRCLGGAREGADSEVTDSLIKLSGACEGLAKERESATALRSLLRQLKNYRPMGVLPPDAIERARLEAWPEPWRDPGRLTSTERKRLQDHWDALSAHGRREWLFRTGLAVLHTTLRLRGVVMLPETAGDFPRVEVVDVPLVALTGGGPVLVETVVSEGVSGPWGLVNRSSPELRSGLLNLVHPSEASLETAQALGDFQLLEKAKLPSMNQIRNRAKAWAELPSGARVRIKGYVPPLEVPSEPPRLRVTEFEVIESGGDP